MDESGSGLKAGNTPQAAAAHTGATLLQVLDSKHIQAEKCKKLRENLPHGAETLLGLDSSFNETYETCSLTAITQHIPRPAALLLLRGSPRQGAAPKTPSGPKLSGSEGRVVRVTRGVYYYRSPYIDYLGDFSFEPSSPPPSSWLGVSSHPHTQRNLIHSLQEDQVAHWDMDRIIMS